MSAEHKKKDQELYAKWAETKSKRDLGNLMNHLTPVIYSEVHRLSGTLPNAALSAEAKHWTIKAIQSYQPDRGVALSTHVMNYLPKVRRLNYKYQNAVRLPENLQLKFHEYNHTLAQLTDQLNREPTDDELANKLGWSKAHTVKFKNSLYADLVESGSERASEYTHFNENAILLQHVLDQLTPDEKFILENKKTMTATQLAAALKININRLNYITSKTVEKIQKIKQDIGMY